MKKLIFGRPIYVWMLLIIILAFMGLALLTLRTIYIVIEWIGLITLIVVAAPPRSKNE